MSILIESKVNGEAAVFSWIPKTGGTALYQALARNEALSVQQDRHKSKHSLPCGKPEGGDHFYFSVVRHPLSWWESCFRFWNATEWANYDAGTWTPGRPLLSCKDNSFDGFIGKVIEREPSFCTRMYEWYCGPPGRQIDLVMRQEILSEDVAKLENRLGVSIDLKLANVTEAPPVEWAEFLRQEIERLECPAIRRFYAEPEFTVALGGPVWRRQR